MPPEEPTVINEREPEPNPSASLLSDITLPPGGREPRVVVGQPVTVSEELSARLRLLADMVGKENVTAIRTTIQRDLDGVAQAARSLVVPSAAAAESQVLRRRHCFAHSYLSPPRNMPSRRRHPNFQSHGANQVLFPSSSWLVHQYTIYEDRAVSLGLSLPSRIAYLHFSPRHS